MADRNPIQRQETKPEARQGPLTLSAAEPQAQIRIEHNPDGSVRLEQMAYSKTIGWYAQKSFIIPADLLASVVLQMRKAQCLNNPQCPDRPVGTVPFRLHLTD